MDESGKEDWSEEFERAFNEALMQVPRGPQTMAKLPAWLREIFDNPRLRYRCYEGNDLSWLQRLEQPRQGLFVDSELESNEQAIEPFF